VKIIAPWRIEKFRQPSPAGTEMIAYCAEKNIPVKASSPSRTAATRTACTSATKPASSKTCGERRRLVDFGMTVSPQQAPDKVEKSRSASSKGVPVSVNGKKLSALAMVEELNKIGGRNGVGRIDMVENRFVGMKSRGVYEAPGMTILYDAHRYSSNSRSTAT
jgi:argininosuccinate synthase